MKQNKIKYSILVPTYNKCEYLKFTVESILQSKNNDFELIISDDHSDDGTEIFLSNIKDERVKILKPPIKLTQTKNYEFLLDFANGEWVTILGDDDGIMPNFFDTLDELIKKYPQHEIFKFKRAIYYWDGVSDMYGDRVVFYEDLARTAKIRNSKLNLLFSLCGLSSAQDLPMIYTSGVVKNSLVKRIKDKSENFFFHSVVPDYYSMAALSFECSNYVFSEKPVFWVGVSSKSAGRKRKIYFDTFKDLHKKNLNIKINNNLELTGKISKILHKLGLTSAYLFEAILKHPYKKKFWTNKIVRTLVYSSIICNYIYLIKQPGRIKLKLKKGIFCKIILKEIKLYKLNLFLIFIFSSLIYLLKSSLNIMNRINIYIEKFIKNIFYKKKPLILVSKNRIEFGNFIKVNKYLKLNND